MHNILLSIVAMHRILIPLFVGTSVVLGIWGLIELNNYFDEKNQNDIANEIKDVLPAFEIASSQLEFEYIADEIAAQEKYEGEVVLISGLVRSFKESSSPRYIKFLSSAWEIRCRVPNSQVETIKSVIKANRPAGGFSSSRPQDTVTPVRFQMKGRVGSHESLELIRIDGCTFQQTLPR